MTKNIEQTLEFLKLEFQNSEYFKGHPKEREYRLRHSIRVANIGAEIAKKENMNVEAMTIACLLHDISYRNEFKSENDWKNHGRTAALIAKEFLNQLSITEELKQEICFGIAIHVDDQADFEGNRTAFAQTVGDSDNIDRFDVYRIYENLQNSNFSSLPFEEQLEHVNQKINRISKLKELDFGSNSAIEMWSERLSYQLDFFARLRNQLQNGESIINVQV